MVATVKGHEQGSTQYVLKQILATVVTVIVWHARFSSVGPRGQKLICRSIWVNPSLFCGQMK